MHGHVHTCHVAFLEGNSYCKASTSFVGNYLKHSRLEKSMAKSWRTKLGFKTNIFLGRICCCLGFFGSVAFSFSLVQMLSKQPSVVPQPRLIHILVLWNSASITKYGPMSQRGNDIHIHHSLHMVQCHLSQGLYHQCNHLDLNFYKKILATPSPSSLNNNKRIFIQSSCGRPLQDSSHRLSNYNKLFKFQNQTL